VYFSHDLPIYLPAEYDLQAVQILGQCNKNMVILANATHRMWEISRDAYMNVSGRTTQEPKSRTGRPKRPASNRIMIVLRAVTNEPPEVYAQTAGTSTRFLGTKMTTFSTSSFRGREAEPGIPFP
jgi:hypothetical protein